MEPAAEARDRRVLELFLKTVQSMGGLRRLAQERRLGWLPPLLAGADTLVLQEEEHRRPDEIADLLGISGESVENMLAAPADRAEQFAHAPPPESLGERETAAGALIRRALSAP